MYHWLPGEPPSKSLAGSTTFAEDLAHFLIALQAVDPPDGPPAGPRNGWRGGPLSVYDAETRDTAARLTHLIDVPAVLAVWDAAIAASSAQSAPTWVHGDMTPSNLLVEDRRLSAVIDFGSCAIGDPACDLVIAWTYFYGSARDRFRALASVERNAWVRARGWALWKALLTLAQGAEGRQSERRYGWRPSARELLADLIADHTAN